LVAGGIVEGPDGLLLVQNRRRDGSLDWSTPGGVIEVHDGESVVDGLTREVAEETGIVVTEWEGPLYEVRAVAVGLGWDLRVEVHRAVSFSGEIEIDDPDGIVVDARFVPLDECGDRLHGCHPWVREPLGAWLAERWLESRAWRYELAGDRMGSITVVRTSDGTVAAEG
jgi:8-oxo-dGTP diphosphatase